MSTDGQKSVYVFAELGLMLSWTHKGLARHPKQIARVAGGLNPKP